VRPGTVGTATALVSTTSDRQDPNTANNTAWRNVEILPATDLGVSITTAPSPIVRGETFTYTITVTNNGPSAATGAVLTAVLDSSLTNVVFSLGTFVSGTNILTAALPTIASGSTAIVTISATPTQSRNITIQAGASNTVETDSRPNNNQANLQSPVSPIDLSITGNGSPEPSTVGQNQTFAFTVANAGPAPAADVVFTQTLPTGFTFVSATPSAGLVVNGQTITIPLGSIAAASSTSVSIVAIPNVSGPANTTASVSSPETDTNLANNSVTVNTTASPVDLAVTIGTSTAQNVLGAPTTFTVTLRNNGPATATNVDLGNTFTGNVQIASAVSTVGTPTIGASNVRLLLGSLVSQASVTLTIVASSPVAGTIQSTATATASEFDTLPGNNSASRSVTYVNTPGVLQFETTTVRVNENAGSIAIDVVRSQGNLGAVTIDYRTIDGTARAGINYQTTTGTLTFASGEVRKRIIVPILADGVLIRDDLTFGVVLRTPGGGALLGNQASALVSVVNTDIDQNPPSVVSLQPAVEFGSVTSFVVQLDQAVVPSTATDPANYAIFSTSGNGIGDIPIPIGPVLYDASTFQVTLRPSVSLGQNVFYRVVINGSTATGLQNEFGTLLDGAGVRGTDFIGSSAIGTRISYIDSVGNLVSLRLTGGGSLTVNRAANGDASLLQLNGLVGRARQTLSGSVRRSGPASTGVTRIASLVGIGAFGDVFVRMTTPPFYVTTITGFRAKSVKGLLPKDAKTKVTPKAAVPAGPIQRTR
jgi:uncharacterized repeat protein (TIGR01451 family)